MHKAICVWMEWLEFNVMHGFIGMECVVFFLMISVVNSIFRIEQNLNTTQMRIDVLNRTKSN